MRIRIMKTLILLFLCKNKYMKNLQSNHNQSYVDGNKLGVAYLLFITHRFFLHFLLNYWGLLLIFTDRIWGKYGKDDFEGWEVAGKINIYVDGKSQRNFNTGIDLSADWNSFRCMKGNDDTPTTQDGLVNSWFLRDGNLNDFKICKLHTIRYRR